MKCTPHWCSYVCWCNLKLRLQLEDPRTQEAFEEEIALVRELKKVGRAGLE
jgi:hypothetical protein